MITVRKQMKYIEGGSNSSGKILMELRYVEMK